MISFTVLWVIHWYVVAYRLACNLASNFKADLVWHITVIMNKHTMFLVINKCRYLIRFDDTTHYIISWDIVLH